MFDLIVCQNAHFSKYLSPLSCVLSFDNKYVQYILTTQNFSTNEADWIFLSDINLFGGRMVGQYTSEFLCYGGINRPTSGYGSIRYDLSDLSKCKLRIKSNLSNRVANLYAFLKNGNIISYGPLTSINNDREVFYEGNADTLMISVSNTDRTTLAYVYPIYDNIDEIIKNPKYYINTSISFEVGFIKENTENDTDTNWIKTDYIKVEEGDNFYINLFVASNVCSITTYNSEKEKISFDTNSHPDNYLYVVPSGVSYVRFSGMSGTFGHYTPYVIEKELIDNVIKGIREQIEKGAQEIFFDNTNSGLESTDVQGAIDEINSELVDTITQLTSSRIDNRCIFKDNFYEASGYYSAVFDIANYEKIKVKYQSIVNTRLNVWALVKEGVIVAVGPYATSSPMDAEIDLSIYDADELYCSYQGSTTSIKTKAYSLKQGLISKVEPAKVEREILAPQKIYSVLNDINPNLLKNGYSAAIYLDHFFTGIREEFNAKFNSSGNDKVVYCPKDKYTAVNTIFKNDGNNINEKIINDAVIGDIENRPFKIKHISTLNSVTRTKRAYFMCIGDSVTHGEYANDYGYRDDVSQRYSSVCEQIALIDNIINNGNDYVIKSIGTDKVQRVFSYDGNEYSFINGVVGLSGATTAGIAALFGQDIQMSYYLNKYRNCDDLGVRLVGSQGETVIGSDGNTYTIGTEANLSQDSGNVFKPTHIIIAVGLNDYTLSTWYEGLQSMIAGLKADYAANNWDEPYIGVIIHDSANTIFPSKHPYLSESCVEWGKNSDSRHDKQYSFIKYWMEHNPSEEEDANKVWLLPAFWCLPPGDSVTFRPANLPDINVEYQKESARYQYGSGWCQGTHFNAVGHWNVGYQVYAWIKYTLAKVFE